MTKTSFVRARIEPILKDKAEHVLDELGITPTQAVTMLYKYVAREHKWPVPTKVLTTATKQTFNDTDSGTNLVISKNIDEIFKKLGI